MRAGFSVRLADNAGVDHINTAYCQQVRSQWGERLRQAFSELPNPDRL